MSGDEKSRSHRTEGRMSRDCSRAHRYALAEPAADPDPGGFHLFLGSGRAPGRRPAAPGQSHLACIHSVGWPVSGVDFWWASDAEPAKRTPAAARIRLFGGASGHRLHGGKRLPAMVRQPWLSSWEDCLVPVDSSFTGATRLTPSVFFARIASHDRLHLRWQYRSPLRGKYQLRNLDLGTRAPFGLVEHRVTIGIEDQMIVYPQDRALSDASLVSNPACCYRKSTGSTARSFGAAGGVSWPA